MLNFASLKRCWQIDTGPRQQQHQYSFPDSLLGKSITDPQRQREIRKWSQGEKICHLYPRRSLSLSLPFFCGKNSTLYGYWPVKWVFQDNRGQDEREVRGGKGDFFDSIFAHN